MKRKLLTLAGALFVTATASAQITLSSTDYTTIMGIDTLTSTTATSTYPSNLSTGTMTSATWDLTTLAEAGNDYAIRVVGSGGATFADSVFFYFSTFIYQGNIENNLSATALTQTGVDIQRTGYSISSVTFSATDSLIINSQNIVYSNPRTKILFPATYGSTWSSTYNYDFDFTISVALLTPPYDHAPGVVRAYVTETDSVIGWGKMKVTNYGGTASGLMDVLKVRVTESIEDSFFISGEVPSPTLLAGFGVTEGQVISSYHDYYYRVGEFTPLADVTFTDSTFSTPSSVTTDQSRLANTTGVAILTNDDVNVYPNPAVNHAVTVDVPAGAGAWSYELININGQKIATGTLDTHTQVSFPGALATGTYYMTINKDGKQAGVKAISILK